jgi:hypothetical protein
LDALLIDTSDYDVVVAESIAHSYSRIKQVVPGLVIISSEIDDVATCQLLSMLRVDRRSSGIPVLTCPTCREQDDPRPRPRRAGPRHVHIARADFGATYNATPRDFSFVFELLWGHR